MQKSLLATLISSLLLAPSSYANEPQSTTDIEVISIKGSRLDKAATATGLPLTLRKRHNQSPLLIKSLFKVSHSIVSRT